MKMPKGRNATATSSTFQQDMEREIGKAVFCRAILACGNVATTRPELLTQFETVVNKKGSVALFVGDFRDVSGFPEASS